MNKNQIMKLNKKGEIGPNVKEHIPNNPHQHKPKPQIDWGKMERRGGNLGEREEDLRLRNRERDLLEVRVAE